MLYQLSYARIASAQDYAYSRQKRQIAKSLVTSFQHE